MFYIKWFSYYFCYKKTSQRMTGLQGEGRNLSNRLELCGATISRYL